MKARSYPVVLSLVAGLLGSAGLAAEDSTQKFSWLEPNSPDYSMVRALGERTIVTYVQAMFSQIKQVLTSTDASFAVGVMHLKDYKLPKSAPGQPVVTMIKRTSLQLRSIMNLPDDADRAALELVDARLRLGDEVPKVLVQQLARADGTKEWRVYRPIVTTQECLACHGTVESLSTGVRAALHQFYPEDKAVNLGKGEWRGLVRVSLQPAPTK